MIQAITARMFAPIVTEVEAKDPSPKELLQTLQKFPALFDHIHEQAFGFPSFLGAHPAKVTDEGHVDQFGRKVYTLQIGEWQQTRTKPIYKTTHVFVTASGEFLAKQPAYNAGDLRKLLALPAIETQLFYAAELFALKTRVTHTQAIGEIVRRQDGTFDVTLELYSSFDSKKPAVTKKVIVDSKGALILPTA